MDISTHERAVPTVSGGAPASTDPSELAKMLERVPRPDIPADAVTVLKQLLELEELHNINPTALWARIENASRPQMRIGIEYSFAIDRTIFGSLPPELARQLASPAPPPGGFAGSTSQVLQDFILRANRLHHAGYVDTSLDLIYSSVDDLLLQHRLAFLDSVLLDAHPDEWPTDIIIGLLTTTYAVRKKLACRARFVEQALAALRVREELDPRTLQRIIRREGDGKTV